MSQTSAIIHALKKSLKVHGKTYADVAQALELSEASVKRLFSEKNFSLERLEKVCQMISVDILDVVKQANKNQNTIQQLSQAQEKHIAEDRVLLLVTVLVLNKWSLEEIIEYYKISETECIQKLAHLDRLKVIELLLKNKIKLRVAANFTWLSGGPIQRFFQSKVSQEFFQTQFSRDDECLIVLNGMLSPQANAEFQKKLKKLALEFNQINDEDSALSIGEKRGYTSVLAIRSWRYGLFAPLRRLD
ncbi:MAG: helix-turn-helix transcriptional regulator [Gammaproteobacteria bacterium]|nr:helix-turn-helix transcriptional regulator [Gammaproteobacteria bacterium]